MKTDAETMTLDQIRRAGLEALDRELGPVGMVRFIKQFQGGRGDYTRDRFTWLGDEDADIIAKRILARRAKRRATRRSGSACRA
ncbi:MAG TPA: hypothetical protein VNE39_11405 [Planctomycetota bacterium]|nr:hypothetical protein [Planctomycetota bacterium]